MIIGVDHIALNVEDPGRAAADFKAVLGRKVTFDGSGPQPDFARLQLDNVAIGIIGAISTADNTEAAPAIRLVFATGDIDKAAHRLTRRGLPGAFRQNAKRTFDIDPGATHGVPISFATAETAVDRDANADIAGLDHIVIRTPDPERAVALYGGRLGLDLRLDRTNPAFGNRLLFFVCGDLVVEVSHDTKKGLGAGADRIRGLAWRAKDIDRAHARMTASGIDVSEMRTGRRPGTQVFTVKSHTAGVPTLVIGGEGLNRA